MGERPAALGLGAGGHAKMVVEILAAAGEVEVVGLLDPRRELWGRDVAGVRVLGGDELLDAQRDAGVRHAFIGLGSASDTRARRRLYELARSKGFEVVSAVDPSAHVAPSARIGSAVTIMPRAAVNAEAVLGEDVVVNTGAIVEHDCRIGDHVHVASGATLASGVVVEDGAHIGAGATVIQGVRIGRGSVVGAGAVVLGDVDPEVVVVGVPARTLRRVG
jgi:UDP-perosamine 4-acetyltransferase